MGVTIKKSLTELTAITYINKLYLFLMTQSSSSSVFGIEHMILMRKFVEGITCGEDS